MGATIPARIQPGSIDHVLFPFDLVLGRLWLYERKLAGELILFPSRVILYSGAYTQEEIAMHLAQQA
jgi:hypothetical protein